MDIPLVKSGLYRELETREALASFVRTTPRFSMGERCEEFERAFSKVQEKKHSVFVSSGSMANLILLQALLNIGLLRKGDLIGFSDLTWSTNVMPIIQLGFVPVPLDCEPDTLNLSSNILRACTTPLRALFLTNVLGFCGDLDAIRDYCNEKKILLLEDNCESLGSRHSGTLLGNFGLASTYSFFLGHHLSTIEGGMICTDDDALHSMLLMTRAHGWDRNLPPAAQQQLRSQYAIDVFYARYTFYNLAYNGRPTELQGFLGTYQLPFLEEMIERRVHHFHAFQKAVASRPDVFLPLRVDHMDLVSNFAMPVVCRNASFATKLRTHFEASGVEVRPIIAGDMTQQPFYRKYAAPASCPNTRLVHEQGFYFGNNPEMTQDEVSFLCTLLHKHG